MGVEYSAWGKSTVLHRKLHRILRDGEIHEQEICKKQLKGRKKAKD